MPLYREGSPAWERPGHYQEEALAHAGDRKRRARAERGNSGDRVRQVISLEIPLCVRLLLLEGRICRSVLKHVFHPLRGSI